jgi:hypothetical protein
MRLVMLAQGRNTKPSLGLTDFNDIHTQQQHRLTAAIVLFWGALGVPYA